MSTPCQTAAASAIPGEAIVLAGGMGLRLRQVVPDRPKPLAPVAGRPFLAHLLDRLAAQGIRRVILSVGYQQERFVASFGREYGGMAIDYAIEERPLGTAGGIRLGLARVGGERAFVLNGDTLFDAPLAALAEAGDRHRARVVMAVRPVADCSRYGAVQLAGERVTGFHEKGRSGPGLINGGLFLLPTALGDELTGCFSFENDFLQSAVARMPVVAVVSDGFFIDIGVPEAYAAAQTLLARPLPERSDR